MKEKNKVFFKRTIIIIILIVLSFLCYFSIKKDTERIQNSDLMKENQKRTTENIQVTEDKSSGITVYVTANALNVRSGAGTKYKTVGVLKKNQTVTRISTTKNGWSKIKYKGKYRYVYSKYVKVKKVSTKVTVNKKTTKVKPLAVPKGLKIECQKGVTVAQKNSLIQKFNKLPSNVRKGFIDRKGKIILITTKMCQYDKDLSNDSVAAFYQGDKYVVVFSLKQNAVETSFYHEFGHFFDFYVGRFFICFHSNSIRFQEAMNKEKKNMDREYAKSSPQEFWADVYELSVLNPKKAKKLFPESLKIINEVLADFK